MSIVNMKAEEGYQQINPYNFISLEEECTRLEDSKLKGELTGVIECELEAKTPLILPDTNDSHIHQINLGGDKIHNSYDTFQYGKYTAVIPGSEIRGMLRSDYEVFTNSCMSTIDQDIDFVSRFMMPRLPGILKKEDGKWSLYQAERHIVPTYREKGVKNGFYVDYQNKLHIGDNQYQTGDIVSFDERMSGRRAKVTKIGTNENLRYKGILFIGEPFPKKKHDSIFTYKKKGGSFMKVEVNDLEKSIKDLKITYEVYNDKTINKNLDGKKKTWYTNYFREDIDELPVWYSEPNQLQETYLSLAQIGKEKYHRTIEELVGDYMPCIDKKNICKTCDLFGFVSNTDKAASKIRISDATTEDTNCILPSVTIKELATPHHSNALFYSLLDKVFTENGQSSLDYEFNYDYKISRNQYNRVEIQAIDKEEIKIRGRKAYWHHDTKDATTEEKTVRNCTVKPVKTNTKFQFKVYFDKISQQTLEELIAVIELKYQEKDLCHKIGRGKPLGYGSIKINVNNVYLRKIGYEEEKIIYDMIPYDKYFQKSKNDISLSLFPMDTVSMKEALRIYDFNYLKTYYPDARVQYPIGADNRGNVGSHLWFVNNKTARLNRPYVAMVLPRIIDGRDETKEGSTTILDLNTKTTTEGISMPKLIPTQRKMPTRR